MNRQHPTAAEIREFLATPGEPVQPRLTPEQEDAITAAITAAAERTPGVRVVRPTITEHAQEG